MADFDPVSYMMGQKAAGGGGGGGSSTLSGLTDVDISNPTDGQTLVYDAESQKWENGNPTAGGGFVLLDGVYDNDAHNITLPSTALSLFTLMQTKAVFIRYTGQPYSDYTEIGIFPVLSALYVDDEGDISYRFHSSGEWASDRLAGSDAVVFSATN